MKDKYFEFIQLVKAEMEKKSFFFQKKNDRNTENKLKNNVSNYF